MLDNILSKSNKISSFFNFLIFVSLFPTYIIIYTIHRKKIFFNFSINFPQIYNEAFNTVKNFSSPKYIMMV